MIKMKPRKIEVRRHRNFFDPANLVLSHVKYHLVAHLSSHFLSLQLFYRSDTYDIAFLLHVYISVERQIRASHLSYMTTEPHLTKRPISADMWKHDSRNGR